MPETAPSGWRRFFGLPSTALGWASPVLLAAFFAIVIIGQGQLRIDTRLLNVACLLASGITGLVALIFKRERSWLVWVPVVFALVVFGAEIVQGIMGGD
jgi:hypothetical protein